MKDNPFKIQEGSIKDAKVSKFIRDKKSGDYLDLDVFGKSERLGRCFDNKRLSVFFYIFLACVLMLFIRSFYLQIIKGSSFRDVAEGNRIRFELIPANRGLIYDRFGEVLVKNVSYFFLYINTDLLPQPEKEKNNLFTNLTKELSIDLAELSKRLDSRESGSKRAIIYENLPYDLAIKLMVLSENYPAIELSYEPRRSYFSQLGLSHALGYLGEASEEDVASGNYNFSDRIGKSGIELVYEDILRGKNGYRQLEVDAFFSEKNIISMTEPIDGTDIILTIDAKAQAKLFEIMKKNSELYDKPKMAAVILDPKDGGILAMNSLPAYDNNIFSTILNKNDYNAIIQDESTPLLNRVTAGTYPPGSVFKPIVASAALEEKIITENFRVNSTGGINVGGNFFPDWRPGGHGSTDIYWAIADSVNTFFYSIGGGNNEWLDIGLGADKIIDYAKKFGLGKNSGVDLTLEDEGFLPSKEWKEESSGERWYLGDTYNLSIGQGYLLVTPIQIANLMSYFASGGTVYKPHFIKEIKLETNQNELKPEIALTNIISSGNLNILREALRKTVVSGSAQSLQSVPVKVAGKTGTAQFNKNKTPHSWFASFAPYEDPKIVMTVLVEEGGDRGLAVTISREFMEWYFSQ
ncbi:MAG: penicillin-binding protein 2 [bacterium]|nr:penicillin-binding protein 2 [bacterium]